MGSVSPERLAVPQGIYCPTITFFTNDSTQDLDLDAQARHAEYLIKSGVHGITVLGTTGEAPLLSNEERNALTQTVVSVRNRLNATTAITVGCSAQSVRETVKLCEQAKDNGGDYALVLPPSYWAAASTPAVVENFTHSLRISHHFQSLSIPSLQLRKVDMNSDLISKLAGHSNIVGVKLTCGNVGKLARLTNAFKPSRFAVFGGSSDWLIPGLIAKSCGAVTGLANTHPRSCVRLFDLFQQGRFDEAQNLQGMISRAEWEWVRRV